MAISSGRLKRLLPMYLVATLISPPRSQLEQWHHGGHHGEHQLGVRDLGLLPLTLWPTSVSLATVWASWLLMGCPKWFFYLVVGIFDSSISMDGGEQLIFHQLFAR